MLRIICALNIQSFYDQEQRDHDHVLCCQINTFDLLIHINSRMPLRAQLYCFYPHTLCDLLCVTVVCNKDDDSSRPQNEFNNSGKEKNAGREVPFDLNYPTNTERKRQVLYLRKPPVSASMASGVITWTASSIMFFRARASALLTALEMSP